MSNQNLLSNIANNSTVKNFIDTKFFQDFVLQKEYYPYQFDGWNDKPFYGLVDNRGRAIYPNNAITALNSNTNAISYKNLIFVVDAFNDLKNYHRSLQSGNKFENNSSIYINPQAARGSVELDDIYIKFSNNTYKIFQTTFLTATTVSSIKTLNDFVQVFISYIKIAAPLIPINRSSFIKSKFCDPNLNGLNIDLQKDINADNIQSKADNYLSDPNFDIFIDSARRYGFYVDKNAPWRIVADLQSPVMRDYYRRYNFSSLDQLLATGYHVAYYSDLDVLKNLLVSFWNTFASTQGAAVNQALNKNCSNLFVEITSLNQIDVATFDQHFNINWLLRLYLFIKILENKLSLTQNKFEIIYGETIKLNNYVDTGRAIEYINTKIDELLTAQQTKNMALTTPDEFVKMLAAQQTKLPVSGISF